MSNIPAITGTDLIKLLLENGWIENRRGLHGVILIKRINDRTLVTTVPDKPRSIPKGTLMQILGPKQTKLGTKGLLELLRQK